MFTNWNPVSILLEKDSKN